jgi:phage terminase large subunit
MSYSWEIDPQTEAVLPTLADKKNHTIDSARYALEGIRRGGGGIRVGRY